MNKQEFALFASALRTYYPKESILPNQQAAELWYRQLQDLDYKIAEIVLNKWVATNKWSPSIADIREQAAGLTAGAPKDWGDAWESVRNAVRRYGSYREVEALESLDDLTRQAVKRLGFKSICMSENIAAERANFRMIYEQLEQRAKQDSQIPPRLKKLISSAVEKLQIPEEKPKAIEKKEPYEPYEPKEPSDKTRELVADIANKLGGKI